MTQKTPMGTPLGCLVRALKRPQAIAPLVVFRISFGLIMVWEVCRYASKGWIKRQWIDPSFYFKYYGFAWVEPWPGDGMYWHFALLGVCALLIALGLAYRVAALLFFVGFSYVFLLDQTTYLNHFYLIALLAGMAIFLSPHRAFSLDAWRMPSLRQSVAPAWQLGLLRFQIALVYGYAGVAKLNGDWLQGLPMKLWLPDSLAQLGALGAWLATDREALWVSYGGLFFDLLIVPALLWRRTRVVAFGVAVLFHLCNAWLFSIGVFPWLMIALTSLFFSAEAWQRGISRIAPGAFAETKAAAARALHPVALTAIALFALVQLAMPLRHWAYPGHVAWTEEGHRFAWRMKLRGKSGGVRFRALDPQGKVLRHFVPSDYLNRAQAREMARRPDLILQFAHFLADEMKREGFGEVQIMAESQLRLNGRAAAPLVKPGWDLAAEPRSLRPAAWIAPEPVR